MSDCVFCDIVSAQESAYRLYEEGSTLAFLDAAPVTSGYSLVVPLTHYETLTDMEPNFVASLFRTTQRVASAVESVVDPDSVNIIQ